MKKIYFLLLLAVTALGLSSCSDNDGVSAGKRPLEQPVVASTQATVSSLTFTWSAIDGATQYAYELLDADSTRIGGGVSAKTTCSFTGLEDNTNYIFKVWAYGAVQGDRNPSSTLTMTAKTNAIVPLDSPDPSAETGNGTVTLSWAAVENATSYYYSYEKDGATYSSTTTDTTVTLRNLSTGDYTVTIYAMSDDEAYSESEPVTVSFHVESRQVLWSKEGYYWSTGHQQWFDAVLVAYDDNTYTIEHPFGEEGYDITFSVGSSNEVNILNSYSASGGYYYVATGSNYYIAAYTAGGYSAYEPAEDNSSGDVWFYTYTYDYSGNQIGSGGYDQFQWSSEESELTIDDLVGTYTSTDTGQTMFLDWSTWQTVDQTETVTITKVDDTTVTIGNFFDWGEDVSAVVDTDERTITLELKTDWGGYYTLCLYGAPSSQVVGTVASDGTITFEDFTAYYAGYSTSYLSGMKSVLTKQ